LPTRMRVLCDGPVSARSGPRWSARPELLTVRPSRGASRRQFRPFVGRVIAESGEDFGRKGNRGQRTDEKERPADGPALVSRQAIRQEKAKP